MRQSSKSGGRCARNGYAANDMLTTKLSFTPVAGCRVYTLRALSRSRRTAWFVNATRVRRTGQLKHTDGDTSAQVFRGFVMAKRLDLTANSSSLKQNVQPSSDQVILSWSCKLGLLNSIYSTSYVSGCCTGSLGSSWRRFLITNFEGQCCQAVRCQPLAWR